jgi:fatty-acyl-CoA synthase
MNSTVPSYDWTAYHADLSPDKMALVDEWRDLEITYSDLEDRVRRLAVWLHENGVSEGERVAFLSQNTTDIFEALFACAKLGAILVPLNWRLAVPELQFIVDDCRPRVLIHEPDGEAVPELDVEVRLALGEPFEGAKGSVDPTRAPMVSAVHDDPWAILYTSGTTGHPKGAIETHGMFFWNAVNIGNLVGLTKDSAGLNVLPTFHTGGLNLYTTPLIHLGGTAVNLREFDGPKILEWLSSARITHFFGVPAIYQFLAEDPGWETTDLSPVESWACGGSPMPVALLERYAERDVVIRQGMGLTETSPTLFLTDEANALSKAGSVGKTALHTAVRIVGEEGNDVEPGEIGELWAKGPNVTPGYWERPEANEESFTDGWLHTGDAARMDEDGYVYIVDRWKDMYISGGENVYPAEVEQVLFRHENVMDVAVVGVPDERWGEVGLAIVVPRDREIFDPDELLEFCQGKLARYKIPKRIATVEELPRNAGGKVLKRNLREDFTNS